MVELTEHLRQTILMVISILALICFFSSFMLFVCAAYIKVNVDARMKLIETYNSDVLPAIFVFVAVINLVQNLSCLFVCLKLRTVTNREKMMRMLLPILIGGIFLVIFEVSSAIASFVHISILEGEFETGLKKGMTEYVKGGELKVEMDNVQSQYGCCGDQDYTNWFTYSWIDPQYLRASKGGVKKYFSTDGKYYSDDTPFSCCDMRSPRPCIHHHIHDNTRYHNYDHKVETTLHVQGCRQVLMEIYSNVLWTVAWVALLTALVKTTALMLFRLIQTSLILAEKENDWEATTPAYIYYLKVEDGDLQMKRNEDEQDNKGQGKSKKGNTMSDSENETGDAGDSDTEGDESSKSQSDVNTNYDDDSIVNDAKEGKNETANKPIWRPLFLPPPYQDPNYIPEQMSNRNEAGGNFNVHPEEVNHPWSIYNAGFPADNEETFDNNYYNVNEKKCSVQSNDTETKQFPNPEKDDVELVPSFYNVSSCGELVADIKNSARDDILAWLKKTVMNSKDGSKRDKLDPQYPRYQRDGRQQTSKPFASSSRGKKRQMKFRTRSDNYKYALVNTSSNSEAEEEEDEEEEEVEKSSENESDNYAIGNSNTDKRGITLGNLLSDKRDNSSELSTLFRANSDCQKLKNNIPQSSLCNLNDMTGSQAETNPARLICSRDGQQKQIENQSGDGHVCNDRSSLSDNNVPAGGGKNIEPYPAPRISRYHEENEEMIQHTSKLNSDRRTKSGQCANDRTRDSLSSTVSKNISENLRHSLNTTSSDIKSRYDQNKHATVSHPGFSQNYSNHKHGKVLIRKFDSSETESDATILDSGNGNNQVRRFFGRSTPFPYKIIKHQTIYCDDYDLIPTNIRRSNDSTSTDSVSKHMLKEINNNLEPNMLSSDIPESDIEVARLTNSAKSQETSHGHVSKSKKEERKSIELAPNGKEVYQQQLQQNSMETIATLSSKSPEFPYCSQPNAIKRTQICPEIDQCNPCVDDVCQGTKTEMTFMTKSPACSFSFPLMLPSPSSRDLPGPTRNHVRSYQRRSIFLSSPISPTNTISPLNPSSPHLALFNSPFMDSPMETSTPIRCVNRTLNSARCATLDTPTLTSKVVRPLCLTLHKENTSLPSSESVNITTLTLSHVGTKQAPLVTSSYVGTKQAPLVTSSYVGTKQAPLVTSSNVGTKQAPLLTYNNVGTEQTALLTPSNIWTKQVQLLIPNKVGTKQELLLTSSVIETKPVPPFAINEWTKPAALQTPSNIDTKSGTVRTPSNIDTKCAALRTPSNIDTKRAALRTPSNIDTKRAALRTPSNIDTKRAALRTPSNIDTKPPPNTLEGLSVPVNTHSQSLVIANQLPTVRGTVLSNQTTPCQRATSNATDQKMHDTGQSQTHSRLLISPFN